MVNMLWKSFGVSVRGPGHVRNFLPNQDAFVVDNSLYGDVIVVSDGIGSHPTSEYGSAAACRAVTNAARNWQNMNGHTAKLLEQIHRNWLVSIKPFKASESGATCLFACRPAQERIILGMLGDGLVAVLKTDGTYKELSEDKDGSFSNQTAALSENMSVAQWRMASVAQEECCAVLLCTDGVADDLLADKQADFVRHIYEQGQKFASISLVREMRKMLEQWPVPKHSDDKTLVCLYQCKG